MTDIDRHEADQAAVGTAMTLPTWVLRLWERRAFQPMSRGASPPVEQARLLGVRAVLRRRDAA